MAFISIDPTPVTAIAIALGNLFQLGQDLSVSFNEWANKVAIPGLERASVERRLRRAKWRLNHYPGVKIVDEVAVRFPDQTDIMIEHIINLLKGETGRVE